MHSAIHFPVLINVLGHVAGTAAFGALLALLVRAALRDPAGSARAPLAAAGLALFWNLGSLAVLLSPQGGAVAEAVASLSFAVLSLLPGVLLDLALGREHRWLRTGGYLVSATAALAHLAEAFGLPWGSHELGLNLITYGFGALAVLAAILLARGRGADRGASMRTLAAMSLFLLAASFVHFGVDHGPASWTHELLLHHAGIPLALFVLLQDYRFLLLDVFVRLLGAALLAACLATGLLAAAQALGLVRLDRAAAIPLAAFLTLTTAAIVAFPWVLDRLRGWVQGALFRRRQVAGAIDELRLLRPRDEDDFLEQLAHVTAAFVQAKRRLLLESSRLEEPPGRASLRAHALDRSGAPAARWAEVAVPIRVGVGRYRTLLLGPREGGRRYLSEDLADLDQLALEAASQLERLRREEQHRLLAEAELGALRAQINPHFLFNSLNALYGLIPRSAADARSTLLNLADIFRYSLQGRNQYVSLAQELQIVDAYLQIERLRLGSRLDARIDLDEAARGFQIPALSIQPLVENAVKHGVSGKPEGGSVLVSARLEDGSLVVDVIDDGVGFEAKPQRAQAERTPPEPAGGHGLHNVRRRLELCYGDRADLEIASSSAGARVRVRVSPHRPAGVSAETELARPAS
ncbi:MAG: hypothetical protein GC160_11230 [Acidobacteria bacterium]|nr:hypothetical protein [Acidobacteriota bacterium]